MITDNKITEFFCLADDFCKYFSSELKSISSVMARSIAISQDGFPMPRSSPS